MSCYNPFSFVPIVVTLFTALVYLAVLTSLVVVHENVPPAPLNPTSYPGLNLSEAWHDLTVISKYHHPYNSRRNDDVRNFLLQRIDQILTENGVKYATENTARENLIVGYGTPGNESIKALPQGPSSKSDSLAVTIFNDLFANYTSTGPFKSYQERTRGISTYFEGNNIIVYIRGSEDEEGEWWKSNRYSRKKLHGRGGVMINTHFDSVSTSFGATDAGVGIVTELQLIKYFSTEGNTPKKGFVALLNNGEEDGLQGSKAFLSHPMSTFVHTFLNLEGAGAGGKAILFRSTDTEVTRAYGNAKHPLGTVIGNDAFALGIVRSDTDYAIFKPEGYRGLDVAFSQPRSRYHTSEDDARHTSRDSVWHMLSASIETIKALTSDTSDNFVGPPNDNARGQVQSGKGSDGVWFDLFGSAFAVFGLRTLFAWSLTLLIASPLVLMLISYLLIRQDKYYFFATTIKPEGENAEEVHLGGWRGFFRFPIAVVIAAALNVGAAFLIRKVNPPIIHSSPYSVWSMSLSLFFVAYWFIMAGCNFVRPSALQRAYVLIWMFIFGWAILVAATVLEDRFRISGGYIFVFYEAAIFLATFISLCEMFALPSKSSILGASQDEEETREGLSNVPSSDALIAPDHDEHEDEHEHEEHAEPTERTSLLGGNEQRSSVSTTFNRYRQSLSQPTAGDDHDEKHHAFGHEQKWSARLPSWTWILQFLILGPFIMIITGSVGLVLVAATNQTAVDGGPLLFPYLIVALFTILIILPLAPFAHRITHHIPTLLFVVFIATLIYNLTSFPFSPNSRFHAYFQQTVDLDTGFNQVTLAGLEKYTRDMISFMPSASGQNITCEERPYSRKDISFCSWESIPPEVIVGMKDGIPPEKYYDTWMTYDIVRVPGKNKATFRISGKETRACAIRFEEPFSAFHVHGSGPNTGHWPDVPESGDDEIRLWSRDWGKIWTVDVEWPVSSGKQPGDEGRSGRVVCMWSDHNGPGIIPALDEVQGFCPIWSTVTKLAEGLVEGSKAFMV